MPDRSSAQSGDDEYQLNIEFCVDSPKLSDDFRLGFVLGWEHCQVTAFLSRRSETAFPRPVHAANEFRLRHLIAKFGRTFQFTPLAEGWMQLDVGPPLTEGKEDA